MKGIRFYREFLKRQRKEWDATGNVIAIYLDDDNQPIARTVQDGKIIECASAVFFQPNSPVASSGVHSEYLRTKCKRISEKRAREIHPLMFEYLES